MAITFPLASGWQEHFAGTTSSTTTAGVGDKNVGTGSNRHAMALVGYGGASVTPTSFAVGSDTLTLQGAIITGGSSGNKYGLYTGALTVTGAQTLTATYATSPGTGFAEIVVLVVQGDNALTLANFVTIAEQANGSSGNASATVTSTSGDVCVMLVNDIGFAATPTVHAGTTIITNDNGPPGPFTAKATASGASTALQIDYAAGFDSFVTGLSITEAAGGGGATSDPARPAFARIRSILNH